MQSDKEAITVYKKRVEELFTQVERWLSDTLWVTVREFITVEEKIGTYNIEKLVVQDSAGQTLAEWIPIGADIIGADGRVDIVGTADQQILLYLSNPLSFESSVSLYKRLLKAEKNEYIKRGVQPGWFWAERTLRMTIYPLEPELVFDLVQEVSDYAVL